MNRLFNSIFGDGYQVELSDDIKVGDVTAPSIIRVSDLQVGEEVIFTDNASTSGNYRLNKPLRDVLRHSIH